MSIIVTHPGPAHRDEFIACCLLMAKGLMRQEPVERIERRNPTAEDMADDDVFVVDQGGQWHGRKLDHHQLPREHAPVCSITAVLSYLGIDITEAREIWQWLEFTERLDSKGPSATAAWLGITPEAMRRTMSPVETTALCLFEDVRVVSPATPTLWNLMLCLGTAELEYLVKVQVRQQQLAELTRFGLVTAGDVVVSFADVSSIDKNDDPLLGLELFLGKNNPTCEVTISQSARDPGLALYRRNDCPKIDFSQLDGVAGVAFAHKAGFLAVTAGLDVNPIPLIEAALVRS